MKRVAASTSRRFALPGATGGGWGGGFGRSILPGADYDYAGRAGDLTRCSAVAACLRVLNANFPQPRLQVETRDDAGKDAPVLDHPLAKLLDRPNPFFDKHTFWGAIVTSLITSGTAYAIKERSGAGIPVRLWWIPTQYLCPFWTSPTSWIDGYRYLPEYGGEVLLPEDVIHFRWGTSDPATSYRTTISPLLAGGLRTVCSLNEADGFTAAILRNMGIPGSVIAPSTGHTINKDQADRIDDQWRHRYGGEGRGKPFIASGPITVTPIQMTPEEMALDAIPGRLEQQICALIGVNAMVAGVPGGNDAKTYANFAEAVEGLYDELIVPMQDQIAGQLDHQLLDDVGMGDPDRESVAWDYSDIACLQVDQKPVVDAAVQGYKEDVYKRSEAREQCGLPYTPDDEVYKSEVGVAVAQATMPPTDQNLPGETPEPEESPEPDTDAPDESKSLASLRLKADELAATVPDPATPDEATIVAKAVATLEAIRAEIEGPSSWEADRVKGRAGRGGGRGGRLAGGSGKPGHAPGTGGQFAPGGGRVPGKVLKLDHGLMKQRVAEAHAAHQAQHPDNQFEYHYAHGEPKTPGDRKHLARAESTGKSAIAVEVRVPRHSGTADEVRPHINEGRAKPPSDAPAGAVHHVADGSLVATRHQEGSHHVVTDHLFARRGDDGKYSEGDHATRHADPARADRHVERLMNAVVKPREYTTRLTAKDPHSPKLFVEHGDFTSHRVTTFRAIHGAED